MNKAPSTPLHLPGERRGKPAAQSIQARREGIAVALEAGLWRTDPAPDEVTLGGVRTLLFRPAEPARGAVLHMHGGAFRIGCPEQLGPFASALARQCQVTVVCPAYRLAPECPFPAGLRDGWAVLAAMVEAGAQPFILSGDSAGAALAAGLAALASTETISLAGLALLSPWLDLTVTNQTFETNALTDPLFSKEAARDAATLYLQGHVPNDPLASPLFGSVVGFPPTFISTGEGEVLVDDTKRFHQRLLEADVATTVSIIPEMEHVAVIRGRDLTGAEETFLKLTDFISATLDVTQRRGGNATADLRMVRNP